MKYIISLIIQLFKNLKALQSKIQNILKIHCL